jgi:hypothetical protein
VDVMVCLNDPAPSYATYVARWAVGVLLVLVSLVRYLSVTDVSVTGVSVTDDGSLNYCQMRAPPVAA